MTTPPLIAFFWWIIDETIDGISICIFIVNSGHKYVAQGNCPVSLPLGYHLFGLRDYFYLFIFIPE